MKKKNSNRNCGRVFVTVFNSIRNCEKKPSILAFLGTVVVLTETTQPDLPSLSWTALVLSDSWALPGSSTSRLEKKELQCQSGVLGKGESLGNIEQSWETVSTELRYYLHADQGLTYFAKQMNHLCDFKH